jgi:hypothetical protein
VSGTLFAATDESVIVIKLFRDVVCPDGDNAVIVETCMVNGTMHSSNVGAQGMIDGMNRKLRTRS